MNQPSPYTPGVTARSVPGREGQIGVYEERAILISELHQFVGRIRVEVAPRGIGKTSLLRQAQNRMEAHQIASVWVTAGDGMSLIAAICIELKKISKTWESTSKSILVDSIESVTLSVGSSNIARVDAKWVKQDQPARSGAHEFESVIRAGVHAAQEHNKTGIAIFIDEVQSSDAESLRTIGYAWQHLQAEGQDVAVGIFAAGLPNSADEITANVTFSERFEFSQLRLIESDAVKLALALPAKKLGVTWAPAALDYAVEHAGGYPHKVQLIGEGSWVSAGLTDPGSVIELSDVRAGVIDADEQMDNLYRPQWRNSTVQERKLMLAMAALRKEVVSRIKVAESMGVKTTDVSMVRARLVEKGFIESPSRGSLAFTIPGFGDWLRNRVDE